MIRRVANSSTLADASIDTDDPDYAVEQGPIISKDRLTLPGCLSIGTHFHDTGSVIVFELWVGRTGLHHALTTAAARRIAARLIEQCGQIEAQAAEQATAALAKAAGK